MGRAPNPGAPQRVSAHVVPKAPNTFSNEDEEEKTTIESGWEDEASTTVEQGEVAEKIRLAVRGPHDGRMVAFRAKTTISIGVASFPDDARVARGLIDMADAALYAAKDQGRDRVVASAGIGGAPPEPQSSTG